MVAQGARVQKISTEPKHGICQHAKPSLQEKKGTFGQREVVTTVNFSLLRLRIKFLPVGLLSLFLILCRWSVALHCVLSVTRGKHRARCRWLLRGNFSCSFFLKKDLRPRPRPTTPLPPLLASSPRREQGQARPLHLLFLPLPTGLPLSDQRRRQRQRQRQQQ